jgi:hypothetical protein
MIHTGTGMTPKRRTELLEIAHKLRGLSSDIQEGFRGGINIQLPGLTTCSVCPENVSVVGLATHDVGKFWYEILALCGDLEIEVEIHRGGVKPVSGRCRAPRGGR